jgi:SAM-dependent methyltransferase
VTDEAALGVAVERGVQAAVEVVRVAEHGQRSHFYPERERAVSSRFWTPVDVAIRAAELLVVDHTTRVLDVGSGAGKFCVIGALVTGASFTGVEHRVRLVDVARECARKWRATGATFVHDRFHVLTWTDFDAFYFYNPFQEGVFSADPSNSTIPSNFRARAFDSMSRWQEACSRPQRSEPGW